MTKLCAVSVDLDEIHHYFAIHGLTPSGAAAHAVYDVAIDRLLAFAAEEKVPMTYFAVGEDLSRPESAAALRRAHAAGTEIANHSLHHRYDLTRLDEAAIEAEIAGGIAAIEAAVGEAPVGFRAPGYTITDAVFAALTRLGVAYDSSVFPCPAYYGAKAAAIAAIRLAGRTSRSVLDDPRVLLAPTRPYRVGAPYTTRGAGLLELPIQVTPGPRLPVIGTSVVASPTVARALAHAVAREPFVNLELHGIDVLDATDDLEPLRPHQFDVRVPWRRKVDALRAFVTVLRDAGFQFVPLKEAARSYA